MSGKSFQRRGLGARDLGFDGGHRADYQHAVGCSHAYFASDERHQL